MKTLFAILVWTLSALSPVLPREISLEDAVELAIARDPEIRRAELSRAAAQRALDQRWGFFLPGITMQAGTTFSEPLVTERRPGADPWRTSASLGLSLQLSAAVAPQMEALAVQKSRTLLERDTRLLALAAQVRRRYYSLVNSALQRELLEEDVRLAGEQARQAQARFENGLVSQRVVVQADLAVERARLAVRQSSLEYDLQRTRFLSLLGLEELPPGDDLELTDSFDLPVRTVDAAAILALPRHHRDAAAEELALQSAELTLRQEILSTRSPTLGISSSWSTTESGGTWGDSFSLGINLSMPLDGFISASSRGQRVARAHLQEEQARITRDDRQEQYRLTARDLTAQVNQAAEQLTIAELQGAIAEQTLELAIEGFQRGTVERLEVERARRDLLDARLGGIAVQYRYTVALVDLALHLGYADPKTMLEDLP